MRVLLAMSHPAHVHLFKNLIWELQSDNHDILVCARDKEITIDLLKKFGFPYTVVSKLGSSRLSLAGEQIQRVFRFLGIIREFMPDISVSSTDPSFAFASWLTRTPYVGFADTEHARASQIGSRPFVKVVMTSTCYEKDFGSKQIHYPGYHELAYLHPNRFTPNPAVLAELGLTADDTYIIIRFVSWQASHDIGQHGIQDPLGLVRELVPNARVLITSETPLPAELEEYRMRVSSEKIFDLLFFASLYIGEGATMASEAAMLGTPSIFVSSLAGKLGYLNEQEKTYDLLYNFTDHNTALVKAMEILRDPKSKENWRDKRERLLKEKIDVTAFMTWFIENYPESNKETKEHHESQDWYLSKFGGL
jgi:uncharacterized protein